MAALSTAFAERDLRWDVLSGPAVAAWIGDSVVLTDDHAPVDQLLTPYPSRVAAAGPGRAEP